MQGTERKAAGMMRESIKGNRYRNRHALPNKSNPPQRIRFTSGDEKRSDFDQHKSLSKVSSIAGKYQSNEASPTIGQQKVRSREFSISPNAFDAPSRSYADQLNWYKSPDSEAKNYHRKSIIEPLNSSIVDSHRSKNDMTSGFDSMTKTFNEDGYNTHMVSPFHQKQPSCFD